MDRTSTSWFIDHPIELTSVSVKSSESDGSDMGQSANIEVDEKSEVSSSSKIFDKSLFGSDDSQSGDNGISNVKGTESQVNTSAIGDSLRGDLDFLVTEHLLTTKRIEESNDTSSPLRKSAKYPYFPEDEEEEVEQNIGESVEKQSVVVEPSSEVIRSIEQNIQPGSPIVEQENPIQKSSVSIDNPFLSYRPRNFDYVPPISNAAYEHLNKKTHKLPKEEPIKIAPIYHPPPKFDPPPVIHESKPRIHERIEEKPIKIYTQIPKEIPDKKPTFLDRKPNPKKEDDKKPEIEPKVAKWLEKRKRQEPKPQQLFEKREEVKPIPNLAPSCVTRPEKVNLRKQKPIEKPPPTPSHQSTEAEKMERLRKILEGKAYEWKVPEVEPIKGGVSSEDLQSLSDDFAYDDSMLAEGGEQQEVVEKPQPAYETAAVQMRNQYIKQKMTLKEAQERAEKEKIDKIEEERIITAMRVRPAIQQLQKAAEQSKVDPEVSWKVHDDDLRNKAVRPLKAAIKAAQRKEFLVKREEKRLKVRGRQCAERRNEITEKEEQRKRYLEMRGKRKAKLLNEWNPNRVYDFTNEE